MDALIKRLNDYIIERIDSHNIDIIDLYDFLDVKFRELAKINKTYANKRYSVNTTNGPVIVNYKNDALSLKYGNIEVDGQESQKAITEKLNTIKFIFENAKVQYKIQAPECFVDLIRGAAEDSIIKHGDNYLYIVKRTDEQVILTNVYKGKIKDFSFDRVDDSYILFNLANKDKFDDSYLDLLKNEQRDRVYEVSVVPAGNIEQIINEYKSTLENGQIKNILIGSESLGLAKTDGLFYWYKNGELANEDFAKKVLGYAEATSLEYTITGNKSQINDIDLETILKFVKGNNFAEVTRQLVESSKSGGFVLDIDSYQKDEKGNYNTKTYICKNGKIYETDSSRKEIKSLSAPEFENILAQRYQYLREYYIAGYVNYYKDREPTIERNKIDRELFVEKAIEKTPILSKENFKVLTESADALIQLKESRQNTDKSNNKNQEPYR